MFISLEKDSNNKLLERWLNLLVLPSKILIDTENVEVRLIVNIIIMFFLKLWQKTQISRIKVPTSLSTSKSYITCQFHQIWLTGQAENRSLFVKKTIIEWVNVCKIIWYISATSEFFGPAMLKTFQVDVIYKMIFHVNSVVFEILMSKIKCTDLDLKVHDKLN